MRARAKPAWEIRSEAERQFLDAMRTVKGHLRHDIANAICKCMRRCNDVSEYHRSLLGPAAQPKPKT